MGRLAGKAAGKYQVFLIGGTYHRELGESIALHAGNHVTNLSGKLTLLQSAALMKHAEMNFVNDSAPPSPGFIHECAGNSHLLFHSPAARVRATF